MAGSCALDEPGLRLQLERYRQGAGRRRLTVSVSETAHERALDAIAFALHRQASV
jgi:hypothetical protein